MSIFPFDFTNLSRKLILPTLYIAIIQKEKNGR